MGSVPCFVPVPELTPGGVAGSKGVRVPGRCRAVAVLTVADHHRDAQPWPRASAGAGLMNQLLLIPL